MPRPTDDAVWVCRATYGLCTEHSVIDGHDRCGWYAPADRDRGDLEELRALSDKATGGVWRTFSTGWGDQHVGTDADPYYVLTDRRNGDEARFVAAAVNYVRSRLASPTTGERCTNCGVTGGIHRPDGLGVCVIEPEPGGER